MNENLANQILVALKRDGSVRLTDEALLGYLETAVAQLDREFRFIGVVRPGSLPGSINVPTVVAACTGGTYRGFSDLVVDEFAIALFTSVDGSIWQKLIVYSQFGKELAEIDARLDALEGEDLSMFDAFGNQLEKRSTANCYVVRKAGRFRIPLIYGNGIKAGAVNAPAYTRQGDTYTAEFVNNLGNKLTSPYIEENEGCKAASAGLLWQTAKMVTQVTLADGFLVFDLSGVPATNGLAVLWVKDAAGRIMWSWTIWATTDDLSQIVTLTNHTEVDYDMMPEGLGAIWSADRSHYVTPHYQWGRKDPFIPAAAYNSTTPMTTFDIVGNTYTGAGAYGADADQDAGGTVRSVANSIQMPEKFFLEYDETNRNWNNLAWFNNFWNAAITAANENDDSQASAIKTIYDPCPVGWIMPASRFATGFTTSGSNVGSDAPTGCEVIGSFANGWSFKKNADDELGFFIPAAGSRSRSSGALNVVGSFGYWWSFSPGSQAGARGLLFVASAVYPLNTYNRSNGYAVLPSRE